MGDPMFYIRHKTLFTVRSQEKEGVMNDGANPLDVIVMDAVERVAKIHRVTSCNN